MLGAVKLSGLIKAPSVLTPVLHQHQLRTSSSDSE